MDINIKKLHPDAIIPSYAKHGDAGMDLTATSKEIDEYGNTVYGIGLALEIPFGYAGFIFPRSSVSKYTMDLANSVGVIDSGYRGELICKFKPTPLYIVHHEHNTDLYLKNHSYDIGERVAQIVIKKVETVQFQEVDELDESERGDGGFGSSGK